MAVSLSLVTIVGVPDNWQSVQVIEEGEVQLIWAILFVKAKAWVEAQYNSDEPKYNPWIIGLTFDITVVEETIILIFTCVPTIEVSFISVSP